MPNLYKKQKDFLPNFVFLAKLLNHKY